jgi:hypothetical protein
MWLSKLCNLCFLLSIEAKSVKGSLLQFNARYTLSHIDDLYDKLKRDIGNDFHWSKEGKIIELYSFHCSNCGYRNIHDIKMLTCGCGKELQGMLVYRKIGDTVIYDTRHNRKRGR